MLQIEPVYIIILGIYKAEIHFNSMFRYAEMQLVI